MLRTAEPTSFLLSKVWRITFLILVAATLAACVSMPPYQEYTIAREALRAAEEADSAKYSPAYWLNAESSYRDGERAYKLNQFDKARRLFRQARLWAERAENQTRLKKFESGEVFQ